MASTSSSIDIHGVYLYMSNSGSSYSDQLQTKPTIVSFGYKNCNIDHSKRKWMMGYNVNVSVYLYNSILFWKEPASVLRLCSMFFGITQFYLPPIRFIPARAEQDLEHCIRNDLVASHLPTLEGWKPESSHLFGSGFEPLQCIWTNALTNWANQADNFMYAFVSPRR
jgi:hypothetical protein